MSTTAATAPTAYSRIEALGVCLPAAVQTTSRLAAQVPGLGEVDIERITGIAERRVYDPEPAAGKTRWGWPWPPPRFTARLERVVRNLTLAQLCAHLTDAAREEAAA
ncbi:hypothetical protein AB0D66_29015 [Streptomyces sp. NPDC048270]|uniref:hypothetical protein n=1 Tax=Streptomyces sp. NPDC048270 TaxID=3154615 RepID=UPI0033C5543E